MARGEWIAINCKLKTKALLEKIKTENNFLDNNEVIVFLLMKAGYDVKELLQGISVATADKLIKKEKEQK
ncbi:MAG: hypothetical protein K6T54_07015 [Ignavibacterium sp.]|nr:hypothetical protein [Ignavibacterium sp.]